MALLNNKIIRVITGYGLFFCTLFSHAYAGTTVTISDEAVGNNIAGRAAAATLDDAWANSLPSGIFNPNLFGGGSGYDGSKTIIDPSGSYYNIGWEVGHIDDSGSGTPSSTTFIKATSGTVTYGTSLRIQGKAPNPTTDTRLSTGHSASGLNAILLDFSSSITPVYEFGVFIGDLESRLNNGTAARMIVFDQLGGLLSDSPIVFTGTVLNGTNYTSVEPLGSPSGGSNTPSGFWGNDTTAFITVKSDQVIGKAILHTGDDDHTVSNDGTLEQLGMTSILLPYEPFIPPDAVPEPQYPVFEPSHQSQILPGNVLFYAHKFSTPVSGSVRFSNENSGNHNPGWAQWFYLDTDCDGVLNGAEGSVAFYGKKLSHLQWEVAAAAVDADDEICLINKVYAPANVAANDQYKQTITAAFTDNEGEVHNLVAKDVTTAAQLQAAVIPASPALGSSALVLRKTVRNVSDGSGEKATLSQALPGEILEYRIYYRNRGDGSLTDLVINDTPPEYTVYQSSSIDCHTPPAGMNCNPLVGSSGLIWTLSGELVGGASGLVSYQVKIDNL